MKANPNYCTALEAATVLKVTVRRIAQLCKGGDLQARKFGPAWMILQKSVDKYIPPRRGPKKHAAKR